jgi:hypothetical protein
MVIHLNYKIASLLLLITICFIIPIANAQTITTTPTNVTAKQYTTYAFNDGFLQLNTTGIYQWNWGDNTDNTTTTTPQANHAYNREGTYTITITVTATIDPGEDWNASTDWQQYIGTYTNQVNVYPTQAQTINLTIINDIGIFAVLPAIIGASVIILALAAFKNQDNNPQVILVAIGSGAAAVVMTEICAYVIVTAANILS